MLSNLPLVGFIPTTDPERARRFYVEQLKFTFVEDGPYAVVLGTPANTIRIVKMKEYTPTDFTVLGWECPDVEKTVRELNAAGVVMERYAFVQQDELGIWTSPDGTSKVAWFKDPDGNVLSVSQHG